MYREGFPKNPLKLVWGENKAARRDKKEKRRRREKIWIFINAT